MTLNGLSLAAVAQSRKKYGTNTMPDPRVKSAWDFLVDVFRTKINLILLIMAVIFIGLAMLGYGDITEAIGIGIVVIIVAIVNVITHLRSQRSTIELRRRASALRCNVIRGGRIRNIDSTEIVVGDIVLLQAGERIPADGYLVHGHISVNNSVLNGESEEVHKSPIPNFKYNRAAPITANDYTNANYVFAGTTVHGGGGAMCVARVGLDTENAKILKTLTDIGEEKTALQRGLDHLAALIGEIGGICAFGIAVIMVVMHWYLYGFNGFGDVVFTVAHAITLGLTIFVAAVPEGLPFIIEIITAQNAHKMTKANLLAKNPNKIPEAGNIQLLCTDKTGTITYGKMQPVANYTGDGTNIGFNRDTGGVAVRLLMNNIVLNGRAMLDADGQIVGGNSTERALFGVLGLNHKAVSTIKRENPVMNKTLFNSATKFSATTVKTKNGPRTYVMAAPEIILAHSRFYMDAGGKTQPLNRATVRRIILSNARRAMRVIATAYYDGPHTSGEMPEGLTFVSVSALRDDIRPGVADMVAELHRAGVSVMMITGDILETARVIAHESGIVQNPNDIAITAIEFDKMSDASIKRILPKIRVIARATPHTKLRLVQIAREMGLCIGMCGDGTNDAPALKGADVGYAMGDSTDVCKEASDIIITDNNFVSIGNSILVGRTFMHNVTGFLRFQLPINFILVAISILFPLVIGIEALMAVQILIINIVIDSLNSLAFGGEPPRIEYMNEPPAGKNAKLITGDTVAGVLWTTIAGVFIFTLTLAEPFVAIFGDAAMSARFALIIIMAMLNGFCVRVRGFNIFSGLSKNPMFLIITFVAFAGLYACVTFGGNILALEPLSTTQWLATIFLGLLIVPINFVYKMLK
ncbi:MAG: cation-transporting P-type ATPase [Alphaproteobacteria bacterium]|nr:cation-transporting P-type ATPase [Alphaproteobacteria bacterium]